MSHQILKGIVDRAARHPTSRLQFWGKQQAGHAAMHVETVPGTLGVDQSASQSFCAVQGNRDPGSHSPMILKVTDPNAKRPRRSRAQPCRTTISFDRAEVARVVGIWLGHLAELVLHYLVQMWSMLCPCRALDCRYDIGSSCCCTNTLLLNRLLVACGYAPHVVGSQGSVRPPDVPNSIKLSNRRLCLQDSRPRHSRELFKSHVHEV